MRTLKPHSHRALGWLALGVAVVAAAATVGLPASAAVPAGSALAAVPTGTPVPASATPTPTPTAAATVSPAASPTGSPSVTPPASPSAPTEVVAAATCTDATAPATAEVTGSTQVGGTIRLRGTGWCHPAGGGSSVAIKINDGGYSHLAGQGPNPNLTVWQVVEAGDDGTIDVDVRLPTATNSTPAFGPGSYRLRLLSGSLVAGDTIRSVETGAFTVTGGSGDGDQPPGRPTDVPDPFDDVEDLTEAARGGVTATLTGDSVRVTVPGAAAGDWVFLYLHVDGSPRPVGWFALGDDRSTTASLSDVDASDGTHKLAVLDSEGELLGWDDLTVSGGGLAKTGLDVRRTSMLAALFVLAGGAAVASTRRRRSAPSEEEVAA